MTVSIIIPIYNAQAYLRACLESVMSTSLSDMEIILVDDGSTDASPEICSQMAQADPRIRLIPTPNRGVSAARNAGLSHATGKYIAFVDADDLLEGDIIPTAISAMEENQLVCWNVSCLYADTLVKEPEFSGVNLAANVIHGGRYLRACWGKLFLGQIIRENGLRFPEDLYIGEDAVFLLQYLRFAKNVRFLPCYGYVYRIHNASAVRRYKADLLQQSLLQMAYIRTLTGSSGKMQTPQTALCWDIFGKLLENGSYADAHRWRSLMKDDLYSKSADPTLLSKLSRLQYRLGQGFPTKLLCILTDCALKRRKRRNPHG